MTYTAIFGSTAIPEVEQSEQPDVETPSDASAGMNYLPILGCVCGVIVLMVAGCWAIQKMKERKMDHK